MRSIKEYIHGIMTDKEKGAFAAALKGILFIFSIFYGILIRLHNVLYLCGVLRSYKSSIPTVSVGNITLGGTGKTPFVIMLARRFAEKGAKTGVLIRGYGEDEWKLLNDRLSIYGIKIIIGRDRVKKSMEAEKEGMKAIILDDGFQHLRLKRDLDIVLINATDPLGNEKLFPRGILREPLSAMSRADILVITKSDGLAGDADRLKEDIKTMTCCKNILTAVHRPINLIGLSDGKHLPVSYVSGKKVCLVSAICDPSYFKHTLKQIGAYPDLEFVFPDHHRYRSKEIKTIIKKCVSKGIKDIVVTEKDAVKLRHLMPNNASVVNFLVLRVDLRIIDGEEILNAEIDRLYLRGCR